MSIRQEMKVHGAGVVHVARSAKVPYVETRKQLDLRKPLSAEVAMALTRLIGHTVDYWMGLSEKLRDR